MTPNPDPTPEPDPDPENHGDRVVGKYSSYGAILGAALGTIVGIMLVGPHFAEWEASMSIERILAFCAGGAFVGWLAPTIAMTSPAGWRAGGSDSSGSHGGGHGGSGGGDSGGGGCGSGCGGGDGSG